MALLGAPALRLLATALRTRREPELWAGLFFVGTGIGIPLRVLGVARAQSAPETALVLNAAGHLLFAAGCVALLLFVRRVFRPGSRIASLACAAASAAIALTTAAVFAAGAILDELAVSVLLANTVRSGALLWAFFESLRYARLMRRRTRLGLADPVVADRFRLWALWTGALSLVPLLTALARWIGQSGLVIAADDTEELASAAQQVLVVARSALALSAPLAVYGIWMSFFPPLRYVERIRRRAASAQP